MSWSNRQRAELPVAAFVWDAVNSSLCEGTRRFVFLKGFRKEARVLDAEQVGRRVCRQGAVAATADRS
jgi:hypothetical protein